MSKSGWRGPDLDRLYRGHGFAVVEGAKHRLYKHPVYRDLRSTVTRAKSLAVGYVQEAVKLATRSTVATRKETKCLTQACTRDCPTLLKSFLDRTTDGDPVYTARHPELPGCMAQVPRLKRQ